MRLSNPLKAETAQEIGRTSQGLVEAGVLVKTTSPCNTPILTVQKVDKKRWRLVPDLRAVSDEVENFPVKVPNPHTLLLNISTDAQ